MHSFFVDKGNIAEGMASITGGDARHIATVLRLHPGDRIRLCDGDGTEYLARVEEADSRLVRAGIIERRPCRTEPARRVTLYQAIPKSDKLEGIVQKCVELGVHEIAPVRTARCVARPDSFANKQERLCRIAAEAAKQAQRGIIPRVRPLAALTDCDFSRYQAVLHAYEEERTLTLKQALREYAAHGKLCDCAIIIGPEGGFTPEEAAYLSEKGARRVTLGPRVLRTETAGMAMLAMLLYEWEL